MARAYGPAKHQFLKILISEGVSSAYMFNVNFKDPLFVIEMEAIEMF
jgi:hypothetical protein